MNAFDAYKNIITVHNVASQHDLNGAIAALEAFNHNEYSKPPYDVQIVLKALDKIFNFYSWHEDGVALYVRYFLRTAIRHLLPKADTLTADACVLALHCLAKFRQRDQSAQVLADHLISKLEALSGSNLIAVPYIFTALEFEMDAATKERWFRLLYPKLPDLKGDELVTAFTNLRFIKQKAPFQLIQLWEKLALEKLPTIFMGHFPGAQVLARIILTYERSGIKPSENVANMLYFALGNARVRPKEYGIIIMSFAELGLKPPYELLEKLESQLPAINHATEFRVVGEVLYGYAVLRHAGVSTPDTAPWIDMATDIANEVLAAKTLDKERMMFLKKSSIACRALLCPQKVFGNSDWLLMGINQNNVVPEVDESIGRHMAGKGKTRTYYSIQNNKWCPESLSTIHTVLTLNSAKTETHCHIALTDSRHMILSMDDGSITLPGKVTLLQDMLKVARPGLISKTVSLGGPPTLDEQIAEIVNEAIQTHNMVNGVEERSPAP